MKMKLNALAVAAAAAFAVGGAHATIDVTGSATLGNGNVLFLALDNNDPLNPIALTVDLGVKMSDFASASGGGFTALGTTIVWNFLTGTVSGTSATITGDWASAFTTFKNTQVGNDFRFGVVAGDRVNQASVSATNAIAGQGYLATGSGVTVAQMTSAPHTSSGPTGTALQGLDSFVGASSGLGNHATVANGANTATAGAAFGAMGGNFGGAGNLGWNFLVDNGVAATLQWNQQVVANPVVYQLGGIATADQLNPTAGVFTVDLDAATLTWTVVPEPGTYAMLLAGLAAVGFVARRRRI